MQDYIFHSQEKTGQTRKIAFLRIALLILLLVAMAMGVTKLVGHFTSSGDNSSATDEEVIPLPPIEKTRPLSLLKTAPAEKPQPMETKTAKKTTETKDQPPNANTTAEKQERPARQPTSKPAVAQNDKTPAKKKDTAGAEAKPKPTLTWKTHKIASGENLARIFRSMDLPPGLLQQILHSSKTAGGLAHIKPGELLKFAFNGNGTLQALTLERNPASSLKIKRTPKGFSAREVTKPVKHRIATAHGAIVTSLFADGQKAGMSDSQVMQLAKIFGWEIDFALELRKGDRFSIIYRENLVDGKKLSNGPILAAEFINRGKVHRAIRYTDASGETAYYDPSGHAKKRAFIRTPVKFNRISSRFTLKRWHPILKRWRSHKGVDYAAPEGTPVKATGDGRVVFCGRKGGYGNVIFLKHGGRYTTVYGHLSRFARGMRVGKRVRQSQIIGYVGHTGLATGPHLHYEFRVNGVHRNPLTVKLPKSLRLPRKELIRFRKLAQPLVAKLDRLRAKSMVASAAKP